MVPAVRGVVRALDPQIPLYAVESLEATLLGKMARSRFVTVLLMLFGGLAILLALVGLNGVLGYAVARRVPELGVRMALGATQGDVLRLVVGEGVRLAALGAAVILGALGAAAVACWLPARRATLIDPIRALRAE
jgi:ABC-type antimicrobial peptide transport system permease subunit